MFSGFSSYSSHAYLFPLVLSRIVSSHLNSTLLLSTFVKRLKDIADEQSADGLCAGDADANKYRVLYYENIEGGHGGAADNKQQAFMTVLYLMFLQKVIAPPIK